MIGMAGVSLKEKHDMTKVAFNDLKAQWDLIKDPCKEQLDQLFERSNFILGSAVQEFEELFAEYVGCTFAVGVSNGTDALKLAAEALDLKGTIGVVMPANTFVATILGLEQAWPGADIKLIDCNEFHQIDTDDVREYVIDNRHRYDHMVIVPVHLYGYACDMEMVESIAEYYNCIVLEDASQAHGAKFGGQSVGSFGKVSAFSLYPGKNLGAAGDAGIVTTNDSAVYIRLLMLRNVGSIKKYEHKIKGHNHRLDTLQAIILKEKMKYIEEWNSSRRDIVKRYEALLVNPLVSLPKTPVKVTPVHHIYPVMVDDRKAFQEHLDEQNIQHGIHYPILIEEMDMYQALSEPNERAVEYSNKMVSLPIHPFMTNDEVTYLCKKINEYKKSIT
jgi:dTDP-4-amino-4,6-dideoxygalactose transaminase